MAPKGEPSRARTQQGAWGGASPEETMLYVRLADQVSRGDTSQAMPASDAPASVRGDGGSPADGGSAERDREADRSAQVGRNTALMSVLVVISRLTGFLRTWGQAYALGVTVTQGVKDGVERTCKFLLPILGIMLIVLAVHSAMMKPAVEGGRTALDGLKWYLTPDFSKLSWEAVLAALGQAFFSIGIGIATAVVYGSYLGSDSDLPMDSFWVISMDTGFAIVAGVVVFPALFCYGMDPTSGFGLVFEALPSSSARCPAGRSGARCSSSWRPWRASPPASATSRLRPPASPSTSR